MKMSASEKLCPNLPVLLLALSLFALAPLARAQHILSASRDCNCTNLIIKLVQFPNDRLIVQFGGVSVPGKYDFATQQITVALPTGVAQVQGKTCVRRAVI